MKGTGTVRRERSPSMLCSVVFLQCPLVTKPNTVADDKRNVSRIQLQHHKVGQIRVGLEVRGNKLIIEQSIMKVD